MIWLSPFPPSVPNHPGTLLINHLWKKYITARCMFSLKCFQQDPGQRLSGKLLLRGHQIFGLSCTSMLSKTGVARIPLGAGRIGKVCRLGSLSLSMRLGSCQQSHLNRWLWKQDVLFSVLIAFSQPQEGAWYREKREALEKDWFRFCFLPFRVWAWARPLSFRVFYWKKRDPWLYGLVVVVNFQNGSQRAHL